MKPRMPKFPASFLKRLRGVTAKRPKTVIAHILKHGFITTGDLMDRYGYIHPPRAIRDVRENGIPVVMYRAKGADGRSIAAYRFGNPDAVPPPLSRAAGRTALSKALKKALITKFGAKCAIYMATLDETALQVGHRVPYEVTGGQDGGDISRYMLLCPSANRAKSWTCEHCPNWTRKSPDFCLKCFWASPDDYDHVAGKKERAIFVVFTGNEVDDYDRLIALSGLEAAQTTIKRLVRDHVTPP